MSAFRRLLRGQYQRLKFHFRTSEFPKQSSIVRALPCAAILIASSCATSGLDKNAVARVNVDKDNPKGNLFGPKIDVTNMYQLFMKTKIIKVIKRFGSIDHKSAATTSFAVLQSIEEMLQDTECKNFILYYSGHGRTATGDWCFEEMYNDVKVVRHITLNDIISLWENRPKPWPSFYWDKRQKLFIIADSCFSGAWVEAIQNTEYKYASEIIIQSSCGANEVCYDGSSGGVFTNFYKNKCIKYHPKKYVGFFYFLAAIGGYCSLPVIWTKDVIAGQLYDIATSRFTPTNNAGAHSLDIPIGEHDGYVYNLIIANSWVWMRSLHTVDFFTYYSTFGNIGTL